MESLVQDNDNRLAPNVVITGFGPFRDHSVNPSWEAIKDPIKIDRPVNVIVRQVEVSYATVDEIIPELWSKYKPILMVHIGLAAHDKTLRLETYARHGPYIHCDVNGCTPGNRQNNTRETIVEANSLNDADDQNQLVNEINNKIEVLNQLISPPSNDSVQDSKIGLCTCLRLDSVMKKLKKAKEDGLIQLDVAQSYDAGLYVCEYIYLKSLSQNTRAAFIHIPSTDEYPLEEIKKALKLAIEYSVDAAM